MLTKCYEYVPLIFEYLFMNASLVYCHVEYLYETVNLTKFNNIQVFNINQNTLPPLKVRKIQTSMKLLFIKLKVM